MQTDSPSKIHIYAIDYLRVIASLMVVSIHVDTITASSTNYLGGISWWLANIVQSVSRAAVPIFILISGYLALARSTKQLPHKLTKVIRRLLIPSMFWISVYLYSQSRLQGVIYTFFTILKALFFSEIGHLYYLYIILGLSIFAYFQRQLLKRVSALQGLKLLSVVVIISFIISSLKLFDPFITAPLVWLMYVPFFILGSTITKLQLKQSHLFMTIFASVLINAISNYYGNKLGVGHAWWMSSSGNNFLSNFSPTVVLISLSIYYLVMTKTSNTQTNFNVSVSKLAQYTYGVYLIHPFIIPLFDRFTGLPIHLVTHDLWAYFLLKIVIIYVLSVLLIWIIKKIRFARIILGES